MMGCTESAPGGEEDAGGDEAGRYLAHRRIPAPGMSVLCRWGWVGVSVGMGARGSVVLITVVARMCRCVFFACVSGFAVRKTC